MELQGEQETKSTVKTPPAKPSTKVVESWEDSATEFLDELGAIDNG